MYYIKEKEIGDYKLLNDEQLGNKIRKILTKIDNNVRLGKEKELEQKVKQKNCKHDKGINYEVSEWHPNGEPDRYKEYCKECGKLLSS
jgi:hypothetical protein